MLDDIFEKFGFACSYEDEDNYDYSEDDNRKENLEYNTEEDE